MKFRKRWAAAAVVAVCAAVVPVFAQNAAAATPAWEPDPGAQGTITFYNAAGAVVTSGTNLNHLFDYAAASTADDGVNLPKANISFAWPNHSLPTSNWFVNGQTTSTLYPNTSAPTAVKNLTNPVATIPSSAMNLNASIGGAVLDTTAGYANIVQLRLKQTGNSTYWSADIQFDTTAGTWTQLYPTPAAGPTTTTTTLTATESSPQPAGTTIHLNAAVSPSSATGSVQFEDGSTNIGAPVPVSSGHATTTTSTLTVGTHTLHAVFTPTMPTAFTTSTGDLSFTIDSVATPTTTTLDVTPTSPITVGTMSTLNATVSPNTAVGTVQFKDGASNIGSPVAVTSGHAQTTATLTVNTHQLTAVFTPTNPSDFAASTSTPAVSYTVNPAPATPTTTALGVAPASPQAFGTSLTLTGTVSPNTAVGQVQFLDGTTVIGTATVSSGVATATNSTLAAGVHSLTAQFVPANANDFGTSTSAVTSYTINQADTTTTLGVAPSSPQMQGTSLALTATVSPGTLAGAVQFFDGTTAIGSPVAVTSGHATLNWAALATGGHTLKATFQPSSVNYAASTSAGVPFTVQKPPPANTSTTLQVTPGAPVGPNTVETLHATITPATAVGSVQFVDGATNIGAAVPVSGGVAQTTTTFDVGTHSVKAVFTPTDNTDFNASASAPQDYVVKPPATATTTALGVTPGSPVDFGTSATLTATVTPSTAAGTVTFKDGATVLGSKPVSGGTAALTTVGLAGGSHSLTAVFTPSAPLDFAASTSAAVPYTVDAVATTTSLATPAGPVALGGSVALTATVTPSTATGSVTFTNGSTTLGSAAVSGGTAVLHTTHLPVGTASLTATFVPTAANDYHGSTSAPLTLSVVAPPAFTAVTSGGKTLHSGAALTAGQSVTLSGTGFQPDELVEVDVHSAPVKLATAQADAGGHLSVTVVVPSGLAGGAHTLTATGRLGSASFAFVITAGAGAVTPPAGSGSGGLANTGADVLGGLLLALALGGAGAVLLLSGVRRHRVLHRGMHRAG